MRIKTYNTVLAIIIGIGLLFNVANSSAFNQSADFQVGDKFTFNLEDFSASYLTNGTDYSNVPSDIAVGNIETSITGFTDSGVSTTYVNFTRNLDNGNTKAESSTLYAFVNYAGLMYNYATNVPAYTPESLSFTSTPNTFFITPTPYGLPFFATNNEDYYVTLSGSPAFPVGYNKNQVGQNLTETNIENSVDKAANTYHLKYYVHYTRVGTSLAREDFNLNFDVKYSVDVDYGRSVVTSFQYQFDYQASVGVASRDIAINLKFVEGKAGDGGIISRIKGVPIDPIFTIISLSILSITVSRLRKIKI